jgi:hypothetical protein
MARHLDLLVEVFGEAKGCVMFRKMAPWYARRMGPSAEFNRQSTRLSRREELEPMLAAFKARVAVGSSLAAAPGPPAAERSAIPVPTGPNELW